jgi:hypothetical protein
MERTFETPGHVEVVVENEVGSVDIDCRDTERTDLSLEAQSEGGRQRIEEAIIECTPTARGHVLSIRFPHQTGWWLRRHDGVTVRIGVPSGADLQVSAASAPIRVRGSAGRAELRTASGEVTMEDAAGNVQASTASGSIALGEIGGQVRAKTASGDIEVGSAAGADLRGVSGDVRIGALHGDGSLRTVSGSVRIAVCDRGRVDISSVSGDISVGVADGTTVQIDAQTAGGTVRSEIPLGDEPPRRGAGPDVVISARTVSGAVVLERAGRPALQG